MTALEASIGVALRAGDICQMNVGLELYESHVAMMIATPLIFATILRVRNIQQAPILILTLLSQELLKS